MFSALMKRCVFTPVAPFAPIPGEEASAKSVPALPVSGAPPAAQRPGKLRAPCQTAGSRLLGVKTVPDFTLHGSTAVNRSSD